MTNGKCQEEDQQQEEEQQQLLPLYDMGFAAGNNTKTRITIKHIKKCFVDKSQDF